MVDALRADRVLEPGENWSAGGLKRTTAPIIAPSAPPGRGCPPGRAVLIANGRGDRLVFGAERDYEMPAAITTCSSEVLMLSLALVLPSSTTLRAPVLAASANVS